MSVYRFEWDPGKAKRNLSKHKVSFELAATVLRDPYAITIYDDDHSTTEDRWVTMGIAATGILLVVSHTFEAAAADDIAIRIITARRATKAERKAYGGT